MSSLQDVLDYWFETPNDYQKWFFSGSGLDTNIKQRFEPLLIKVLNDKDNKLTPKNINKP